ncbi:DUF4307 domain-containing protein [Streptacidiphilus carbonis]|jgi:hypothetical protein|uniref:DUF4307 domain-containing protein n=1 Tax=Streptacidiphilus carbonis TaxID=105422 RepID=UPI0005A7C8CB|nr:DUF4307 domain-containing protein [Streptacidiphilus carbonis]
MAPTEQAEVGTPLPAGRYGVDPEQRERRMHRVYLVCVALAVAVVALVGYSYLGKDSFSGQVVSFQVDSAAQVQIHLEVSKPGGTSGSCTVRSRDVNGNEVGRVTVSVPAAPSTYDTVVTLRTSGRGTTGELVSCS